MAPAQKAEPASGHDDGADRLVGLERIHRCDDRVDHRRGHGVALIGVVQGEAGDALVDLGEYQRHGCSLTNDEARDIVGEISGHPHHSGRVAR